MSKHTKSLLTHQEMGHSRTFICIDDDFGADGGRDYYLFEVWHGDPDELKANADRLIACWNACHGTPTARIVEMSKAQSLPELVAYLRGRLDRAEEALEAARDQHQNAADLVKKNRDALIAIRARLQGQFDCPQLQAFGELGSSTDDVLHIVNETLARKD